ncbi:MAG: radical SAM protein [Candidatus Heimdallarchaeota archaeon]
MLTNISKYMMTKSFKKTKYQFTTIPSLSFSKDVGIYIHVPFCYSKCSFCPFYKELYSAELKDQYINALVKEISSAPLEGNSKWIYFGGGTPNTLTLEDFTRIINALKSKIEITNMGIELLPSLVTQEYLKGLVSLGFTKISIGIETFSKKTHQKTGRKSAGYNHILEIITYAKSIGLSVAVDLMVGLPEQTADVFATDITKIIQIKPDQITIYPFMIIRGVKATPSCSTKEQFISIETAALKLHEAGYSRKSVWIFVLPNTTTNDVYDSSKDELVNDYYGFGPASFSTSHQWKVVKPELSVWLKNIHNNESFSFIAPKKKSTDDWRKFANRIYDLKLDNSYHFPFYIRLFDFLLKTAGYYRNGYLSKKGRDFSHEITKAVVESLPFPVQNPDCVENYEDYLVYKRSIHDL